MTFYMHAGHYKPRGIYNSIKYDPLNVRPQCVRCNKWLHGKPRRVRDRDREAIWIWDFADDRTAGETLFRLHHSVARKDDGGSEARRERIFHLLREHSAERREGATGLQESGLGSFRECQSDVSNARWGAHTWEDARGVPFWKFPRSCGCSCRSRDVGSATNSIGLSMSGCICPAARPNDSKENPLRSYVAIMCSTSSARK
jgi:hypothetical protein